MYIQMSAGAVEHQIRRVCDEVTKAGFRPQLNKGTTCTVITCLGEVGADKAGLVEHFRTLAGVAAAELISHPFKLSARQSHPEDLTFRFGPKGHGVRIGGNRLVIIAGPCSVESQDQIVETAKFLRDEGVHALRGGAFKPRTSPHGFQGLGSAGLSMLAEAREQTGLPVVTEVLATDDVNLVSQYADVLQIGARNMQNFPLLTATGRTSKPILLKRGPACSIDEMLQAAEYIIDAVNGSNGSGHKREARIMLCPRGVKGFDNHYTRNSADIDAIPVLKSLSYFPVIFDPSHAAGRKQYVGQMALAAIAAGADGLILEVHPDPRKARTDADQQLDFHEFSALVKKIIKVAAAVGRAF